MGKLLENDGFLEDLRRRYLPSYKLRKSKSVTLIEGKEWALPKSLFTHTQARETALSPRSCPAKQKTLSSTIFSFTTSIASTTFLPDGIDPCRSCTAETP
ncbi:hypothetical protein IT084_15315 [Desulfallas sp. Bu1-1]|uniref:hypothetical protein n=1 Tax=Desulfallas sp. Bu1-1 TaxID=2787620 RepID=UPI00189CB7BC|nr:hypothetical protein [Desulfallas sp. Bu1-1]MBF7084322.1 hypothetical protein [Desulfallas sp. Bu1-1]